MRTLTHIRGSVKSGIHEPLGPGTAGSGNWWVRIAPSFSIFPRFGLVRDFKIIICPRRFAQPNNFVLFCSNHSTLDILSLNTCFKNYKTEFTTLKMQGWIYHVNRLSNYRSSNKKYFKSYFTCKFLVQLFILLGNYFKHKLSCRLNSQLRDIPNIISVSFCHFSELFWNHVFLCWHFALFLHHKSNRKHRRKLPQQGIFVFSEH